jgi:hypothetical protein
MLLEYLDDPNARTDTRVVLLYEFVPGEVVALRDTIDRLSRGQAGDELQVDALPGLIAIDGCSLAASLAEADLGVEPIADTSAHFRCALTSGGWQRVCGLLEPFLRSDSQGFQYLSEQGTVEWIISNRRGW